MKEAIIERTSKVCCDGAGKAGQYIAIKQEIQSTWPDWKKKAYNDNFANSAHAKKVQI